MKTTPRITTTIHYVDLPKNVWFLTEGACLLRNDGKGISYMYLNSLHVRTTNYTDSVWRTTFGYKYGSFVVRTKKVNIPYGFLATIS
jgi:hypothetical protein